MAIQKDGVGKMKHNLRMVGLMFGLLLVALVSFPESAQPFDPTHPCTACHLNHGAKGPKNMRKKTVDEVCQSCHGPAGKAIKRVMVRSHYFNVRSLSDLEGKTCTNCHSPHASDAPKLGLKVRLPPRTFLDFNPRRMDKP